mmetsp:Transcript_45483/g.71932  ORF Transcript_45483/g.71932 Transcript_45483/m.71932 type:complete len:124 (+) Transcript_45483:2290-2661(+)
MEQKDHLSRNATSSFQREIGNEAQPISNRDVANKQCSRKARTEELHPKFVPIAPLELVLDISYCSVAICAQAEPYSANLRKRAEAKVVQIQMMGASAQMDKCESSTLRVELLNEQHLEVNLNV